MRRQNNSPDPSTTLRVTHRGQTDFLAHPHYYEEIFYAVLLMSEVKEKTRANSFYVRKQKK